MKGTIMKDMTSNRKKRYLWVDAEANCSRLRDRQAVRRLVENSAAAGIDVLAVDVKPLSGEVLYRSGTAPRLGAVRGELYPEDFDLLAVSVEEGHKKGLEVHAAMNVFSEGHREWMRGPAFEHPEWQSISCEIEGKVTFKDGSAMILGFINPTVEVDMPAVYNIKFGRHIRPGRFYTSVVVEDGRAVQVINGDKKISIPRYGCVLTAPAGGALDMVSVGDAMDVSSEAVYRMSAKSEIFSWGVFVNPIGPAREYELKIIEEIAGGYEIDGIVLDRMRYANVHNDFSDLSKRSFEEWLGKGEIAWPEDVILFSKESPKHYSEGRYFKEWLEWRAWQIKAFAADAVDTARKTRNGIRVGVYAGSWYESYYDVGVNWGSTEFNPGYAWMSDGYSRTGYAELFDFICTGCYYATPTKEEARASGNTEGATVEAASQLSKRAIGDASEVIGSLYLKEYEGNPKDFVSAMKVAWKETDGFMLFDLVYLDEYDWWRLVEKAAE